MVALRPADGFALARAADLVGRRLVRDVDEGSPLVEQDIEEDILRCAESRLDRGVA
jgi:sialic acid synthase SpsE